MLLNIGTGTETTVNDLFATMAQLTRFKDAPVYARSRPGELARSALDPTLAASELSWKPTTSLEQGLRKTLAWFQARRAESG
jgi:UDP-glucose 4-epimerase